MCCNITIDLKKAVSKMIVLKLLSENGEMTTQEICDAVSSQSGGKIQFADMYGTVKSLMGEHLIASDNKRQARESRLRRYYYITEKGKDTLSVLIQSYHQFNLDMKTLL